MGNGLKGFCPALVVCTTMGTLAGTVRPASIGGYEVNKYLHRGIFALMACASSCVAADDSLPEIKAKPIKTIIETVDCSTKGCALSREQFSAMTLASSMYRTDMPKVEKFHFEVSNGDSGIEVTVFPEDAGRIPPYSVPDHRMAVTYIFDSAGTALKKKYFNR